MLKYKKNPLLSDSRGLNKGLVQETSILFEILAFGCFSNNFGTHFFFISANNKLKQVLSMLKSPIKELI